MAEPAPSEAPTAGDVAPGAPERALAAGTARVLALVAVPVLGVAALVAGWPGVLGAAVGLGFVALLSVGSALVLARVAGQGGGVGLAALVGGAFARLLLYAAALVALSGVEGLHRESLAIATAVGVAVTLAYELRHLARQPRLFQVETGTTRSRDP